MECHSLPLQSSLALPRGSGIGDQLPFSPYPQSEDPIPVSYLLSFRPLTSFLCGHPVLTQHLHHPDMASTLHVIPLNVGWTSTFSLVLMAFPCSFHDSHLLYVTQCCDGSIHKEYAFYKLRLTRFAVKHYCQMFGKAGKEVV